MAHTQERGDIEVAAGLFDNAMAGFRQAQSDLVLKLDDDDELYPHFMATLAEPLDRHPGLALAFSDFDTIDLEGELVEAEHDRARATGAERPFDADDQVR